MTWTSTLALCAASSVTAAGLTALYFRSRLNAARASASLFAAWWERDSGEMLIAQAELDLIAEQRRSAGRQSHKAERELFAATTETLRQCVAARDANHDPLEAGRGERPASSAREDQTPPAPFPFSCGGSAAPKADESGGYYPDMPTGHGAADSRRLSSGSRPGNRPAKSAGATVRSIHPAEFPQPMKGAI